MRDVVASVTAAVNGSPCSGHLYTTPDVTETIGQRRVHHTQGGGDAHDQDHPACAAEKRLVFTIDGARRGRQPVTATPVVAPCPAFAWLRVRVPGGVRETGVLMRGARRPRTCAALVAAPRRKGETAAGVLHTQRRSVCARDVLHPDPAAVRGHGKPQCGGARGSWPVCS
jgi:hypothetical protein